MHHGPRGRAVVIGSGVGGLSAAAFLAKDGWEVTVCERAEHPGGLVAPRANGEFLFDGGVYHVGGCRAGGAVHALLGELGVDASALFCELDPDGFERYRFPGEEFAVCRGSRAYRDRLVARFPHEREGLHELWLLVEAVGRLEQTLAPPDGELHVPMDLAFAVEIPALLRWSRSSLAEVLEAFVDDPKLRAVLAGGTGDYGLPPSRASAFGALAAIAHYADGAWFPRGGSGALRDALLDAARRHGARVVTGVAVRGVDVKDNIATGVFLDGTRLEAEVVVSDADPAVTLGRLLPPDALSRRAQRKLARVRPSLSAAVLHLGMRRPLEGVGRHNLWLYPDWDLEALYAPLLLGALPERMALFVTSGSQKDDSGALCPPGCSTLEVTTLLPWEPFARFAQRPPAERGDDYAALTRRIEDAMLRELDAQLPGVVGDVAVKELLTPLDFAAEGGELEGGLYGPAMTPGYWGVGRLGTRTPIEGLFLAGSGVLGAGVASSLLSGRLAALRAREDDESMRVPIPLF